MKKIILILTFSFALIILSCNKDPLGIEENVRIIPLVLPDTTKPDVKTKFRTDNVVCEFIEKIKIVNNPDTVSVRWNPLLLDASATIDTLGGLKLLNFSINAQRVPDTLAEYRKEHILEFNFSLDSFDVVEKYEAEKNNNNYASKLMLQMLPSRKIETIHGNYPITITFRNAALEGKLLILRGRFVIDVPNTNSSQKYDYLFVGEFNIHFNLE